MRPSSLIDSALDASVVGGFTRIGSAVRSQLDGWSPPDPDALKDKVVVITGVTSGIGAATVERLVDLSATVELWGRDRPRTEKVATRLAAHCGTRPGVVISDMGEPDEIRGAVAELEDRHGHIDLLIHNAGALHRERSTNRDGIEDTVASQVIGPFLATALLLGRLRAADRARVVTVSSGGMYTASLYSDDMAMEPAEWSGSEQYARAKRAQVVLNEMWAHLPAAEGITFASCHPGWVDTPGVAQSLPAFRRVVGALLRNPFDAADDIIWTSTAPEVAAHNGSFWHDRRARPTHRMGRTRGSDTADSREQLWAWCCEVSGIDPDDLSSR